MFCVQFTLLDKKIAEFKTHEAEVWFVRFLHSGKLIAGKHFFFIFFHTFKNDTSCFKTG